ncbi:putative zinc-finger protein [Scheffersomyces xylosifermentans]|uniref:putative zinc-finger protein n=1 Tax=Scheffersomyces xylosifermentans TaxID=1304137 RepID=UPI00315D7C6D
MGGNIEKPKPLKVFGRTHYACTRCKLSKIKCSGEKPACSNCKTVNKADACVYPSKDRKIVIMESDLNNLHDRVEHLETLLLRHQAMSPGPASVQTQSLQNQYAQSFRIDTSSPSTTAASSTFSKELDPYHNQQYGGVVFEDFYSAQFESSALSLNILKVCEQRLPDRTYAVTLIEKVAATYSSEFYLIDKRELLELFDNVYKLFTSSKAPLGEPHSSGNINQISLCYLFITFAFGEQLLNIQSQDGKYPGIEYYLLAEHLFRLTREQIDFTFIQSALLLGLYAANLSRYNTVYNYLGVAARSAVAQGYHRQKELPKGYKTEQELLAFRIFAEKAKRLWWSLFVIDTTWATKTVHFQYTDTDVDLPTENVFPLDDEFDLNILEVNVHLTKYVAKFVRLIYGPNIRTFSINYINTSQFNQKLLLKNIVNSNNDLIKNFEIPLLEQFNETSVVQSDRRNVANLFLRYNQLIILIAKPLLSLVFDSSAASVIDNFDSVASAISRALFTSCCTIDIISQLYLHKKIFVLGFWDSQHLFAATIMIIISCLNGTVYPQLNKGIALLKFMAQRNNINAKKCFDKLVEINKLLVSTSEVKLSLQLEVTVDDVIPDSTRQLYNPLMKSPYNTTKSSGDFKFRPTIALPYFPEQYDASPESKANYNEHSRSTIFSLINEIQGWDD